MKHSKKTSILYSLCLLFLFLSSVFFLYFSLSLVLSSPSRFLSFLQWAWKRSQESGCYFLSSVAGAKSEHLFNIRYPSALLWRAGSDRGSIGYFWQLWSFLRAHSETGEMFERWGRRHKGTMLRLSGIKLFSKMLKSLSSFFLTSKFWENNFAF